MGVIGIKHDNDRNIFGCYEVMSVSDKRTADGHKLYNCRCVHCGAVVRTRLSTIMNRKSSKCTHVISIGSITIPVELYQSIPDCRIRKIYYNILKRCYDKNNKDYILYGGKGITVSDEWLCNPISFYDWSVCNGYDDAKTIDRIDESIGYSRDNCRWISKSDNSRFKSNTNYLRATITLSGRQWADLIPEHGPNYINTMVRMQGKEKTIEYLEDRLKDKHTLSTE